MPTPSNTQPGSLDDLRGQRRDLGVNALLAVGPAILAVGAWLALRNQIRRIEAELLALEPLPRDPIDVDSRPCDRHGPVAEGEPAAEVGPDG